MARPENRRVALLSIHPRFADAILGGDKTVELRRTRLSVDVSHIVVYSTSPVRRVVGWFEVNGFERDRPSRLWRRYGVATCLSRKEFLAYFDGAAEGTAISVGRVVALDEPMELMTLGSFTAPQSYRYLDESAVVGLLDSED